MTIFNFVVEHWFLSLVYVLVMTAVVLWGRRRILDAREEKRQQEEWKRQAEQQRARQEWAEKENIRRREARKEWLAKNKPRLYFNTVNGVTAVLRPADYAFAQKLTQRSRLDGFWNKDNVLLPVGQTVVFVTKQGKEMISANTGEDDYITRYRVAGYISKLEDIVNDSGVELVHARDIFVPWLNETLIPFKQQFQTLHDCVHSGNHYFLVEAQAPKELQYLRE